MAEIRELTIEQAVKSPASFMYVWATDQFIAAIPKKHGRVITGKRANERKLLMISADKYLGSSDKWDQYTTAIRQAFINTYGMTPFDALVVLAQGGTVAGKNWEKGVYGIGAVKVQTFYGSDTLTVDKATGNIMSGSTNVTQNSKNVYANSGGKVVAYQKFYTDANGDTYMSQYDKKTKSYYAASISKQNGTMINAANGQTIDPSNNGDLWGNITLLLEKVKDWFLELFGKQNNDKEQMTVENTTPNQIGDGFVSGVGEDGMLSQANAWLLLAAAGGVLAAGGLLGRKGKKKRK